MNDPSRTPSKYLIDSLGNPMGDTWTDPGDYFYSIPFEPGQEEFDFRELSRLYMENEPQTTSTALLGGANIGNGNEGQFPPEIKTRTKDENEGPRGYIQNVPSTIHCVGCGKNLIGSRER